MVSRGDEIELTIESIAFEGAAVAKADGLVYFIPYGVPGDRILARIIRKKRNYVEASIVKIIQPSRNRVNPRCRYFGICGGCRLQQVDYSTQLVMKRRQVEDLFERIARLKDITVNNVIPSPSQYNYRNKMEFSFGTNRWLTRQEIDSGVPLRKGFALGLHIPKRFDKILDLEECFLQGEISVAIVNLTRKLALQNNWSAYDNQKKTGYLRNLIIRTGKSTGETAVNLVTTRYDPVRVQLLINELSSKCPDMVAFTNTINSGPSPVSTGENAIHLLGDGTYLEKLGKMFFRIGPTCFFQPNPQQAISLFKVLEDLADFSRDETLYDLYCGVGAIGLSLASRVKKVVGIENHPESIRFAEINARLNQINNCSFVVGDALQALQDPFLQNHGFPDVLILDPPRAGLHPKIVKRILQISPAKVVYTSCNPATQARDLEQLHQGYWVESVRPVDMFPQTYHIETVVSLKRRKASPAKSEG